jgi:HTH-type transcriptional regulator / antitoxin HigA
VSTADNLLYHYEPDHGVPPGDTLREVLDELDMSQADLARRTGLSTKTVNQISRGVAPLTHETALLLEKVTGVPARAWNRLEAQWQEHLAREHEEARLIGDTEWLASLPVAELQERGWLPPLDDRADLIRAICQFFGVASQQAWYDVWRQPRAAFRRSKKFTIEEGAAAAWLRIGELKARDADCRPFDARRFRQNLARIRDLTVERPEVFEPEMVRLCAEAGVALVFVPELQGTRANGATRWLSSTKALVQLSLRYRREDVFWFSLFHEAGHILLHGKRNLFIESKAGWKNEDFLIDDQAAEDEADAFARDILIPPEFTSELFTLRHLEEIKAFASVLHIPPAIVIGRLQHERKLARNIGNRLVRRFEFTQDVR